MSAKDANADVSGSDMPVDLSSPDTESTDVSKLPTVVIVIGTFFLQMQFFTFLKMVYNRYMLMLILI